MMKCSTLLRLFAATSLLSAPAWAAQIHGGQKVEHRSHLGTLAFDQVGSAVLGPGDLNGDSVPDYLVSASSHNGFTGFVRAHSGATGNTLWTHYGSTAAEQFGRSLVALDDLDSDGVPDIAIGAPFHNNTPGATNGKVYLVSGATGTTIQTWSTSNAYSYLGQRLAVADLNGDGHLDLISGAPKASGAAGNSTGKIIAFDLANNQVFTSSELTGSQADASLGDCLANVGDWNGDGCDDLAVGVPGFDSNGLSSNGRVNVFSGAVLAGVASTPLVLRQFAGGQNGERMGDDVAQVGDIDRDGFKDLLIGSPRWNDLALGIDDSGRATLWSGRTGQLVQQYTSPQPQESALFGGNLAAGDDIDHDGSRDFLISALGYDSINGDQLGAVYAFSSRTHDLLQAHFGENDGASFGASLASIGDLDGDLTHEFVVGASGLNTQGLNFGGAAYVFGREAFFTQDVRFAFAGDTVHYDIDFPGVGGRYKILVSLLGAGPTEYTGVQVPLGPLHIPITSVNYPSWASGFYGILDLEGKANASLALPITMPPITIYTAAVKSFTGASVDNSSVVQILEVR